MLPLGWADFTAEQWDAFTAEEWEGLRAALAYGPVRCEAGAVWQPGAVVGQTFQPGCVQATVFQPGAEAGEAHYGR